MEDSELLHWSKINTLFPNDKKQNQRFSELRILLFWPVHLRVWYCDVTQMVSICQQCLMGRQPVAVSCNCPGPALIFLCRRPKVQEFLDHDAKAHELPQNPAFKAVQIKYWCSFGVHSCPNEHRHLFLDCFERWKFMSLCIMFQKIPALAPPCYGTQCHPSSGSQGRH